MHGWIRQLLNWSMRGTKSNGLYLCEGSVTDIAIALMGEESSRKRDGNDDRLRFKKRVFNCVGLEHTQTDISNGEKDKRSSTQVSGSYCNATMTHKSILSATDEI